MSDQINIKMSNEPRGDATLWINGVCHPDIKIQDLIISTENGIEFTIIKDGYWDITYRHDEWIQFMDTPKPIEKVVE